MLHLAVESPADWWEVEALYDLCFAPGRTALSSYRLRDGVPMVEGLSLLVRDETGTIVAAVRCWPVRVGGAPTLLLGPLAVHPTRQGEGLGGLLMTECLAAAVRQGWRRVLLVGDMPYYRRFGFHRLAGVEMPAPTNPERVLGRSLGAEAWEGITGPVTKWEPGAAPPGAAQH